MTKGRRNRTRGNQREKGKGNPKRNKEEKGKRDQIKKEMNKIQGLKQKEKTNEQTKIKIGKTADKFNMLKTYYKSMISEQKKEIVTITEDDASVLERYYSLNLDHAKNLSEETKTEYSQASIRNMECTEKEKAKKLSSELYQMLISLTDEKKLSGDMPEVRFGDSLTDDEFIELVKKAIDFCRNNKTDSELLEIKNYFESNESNIKELFFRPKLIKDIMESCILAILVSPYNRNELHNNFSFLSIKIVSYFPLINIPFTVNNHKADLHKEEIINDATSYIPLHYFNKNMKNFIDNYEMKSKELLGIIKKYIEVHNFYFAPMKDDIQAFTVHTGDIFFNIKYLREYFDEKNDNLKIIIREKIILIIFHELNHGLTREIDLSKKNNFLITSKVKGKNKDLKFKEIFVKGYLFLSSDESGNYFDFLFYNGNYIAQIDDKISELYFNINKYKTIKKYREELEQLLKKMDPNLTQNVFKFKKNYLSKISQCLFSLNRPVKK